jgi:tRNA (guanosine-2'-O-)-methyltransferase
MTGPKKRPADLRAERRSRPHGCWGHLIVAPLWVAYQANLVTLLRTCDAVGACIGVPHHPHYRQALRQGNTLPGPSCVHWARSPLGWLRHQKNEGIRIVGVELAEGAVRLADLTTARGPTAGCRSRVARPAGPPTATDLKRRHVQVGCVRR